MTSLVSWIAIDSRAPSSLYIASDSRISWQKNNTIDTWDNGQKLFASQKYPEILGYVGTVLFPSQALSRIIGLIDSDLLFNPDESPKNKRQKIIAHLKQSFSKYPKSQRGAFQIIYCTRENSSMHSVFHMSLFGWSSNEDWVDSGWINLPKESGIIKVLGSGKNPIEKWHGYWDASSIRKCNTWGCKGVTLSVYGETI